MHVYKGRGLLNSRSGVWLSLVDNVQRASKDNVKLLKKDFRLVTQEEHLNFKNGRWVKSEGYRNRR